MQNELTTAAQRSTRAQEQAATRPTGPAMEITPELLGKALIGASKGAEAMAEDLTKTMIPLLAIQAVMKEFGFPTVFADLQARLKGADSQLADFTKQTGLSRQAFNELFVESLMGTGKMTDSQGRVREALKQTGLTTEEIKNTMVALTKDTTYFRREFVAGEPEMAAFTVNMIANLKQLGVEQETSAKTLDTFNRVMRLSPEASNEQLLRVRTFADVYGLSLPKSIRGFNDALGASAPYGKEATRIYGDLLSVQRETGIGMETLGGEFVKTNRTFKGASDTAAYLNAVLDTTAINASELAMAEPAEAWRMVAVAATQGWDALSDKQKLVRADAAKMTVDELARLASLEEGYSSNRAAIELGAGSQEELRARTLEARDAQALLMLQNQGTARSMDEAAKGIRKISKEGGETIDKAFEAIRDEIGEGGEAAASYMALLTALATASELVGPKVIAAAVGVEAITDPEERAKAIEALEDQLKGMNIPIPDGLFETIKDLISVAPAAAGGAMMAAADETKKAATEAATGRTGVGELAKTVAALDKTLQGLGQKSVDVRVDVAPGLGKLAKVIVDSEKPGMLRPPGAPLVPGAMPS